ncbi:hypothetical protein FIBSPDRAFT_183773 [Athelia psychrophila]|uniref:Uncharacterized protein n=1 Tax=Athelia psychrophila TaxID=1759441 RepID=A0A166AEM4_9AGAM|nr:hypothetical protein FIBSPDRAFT_183773 [Fibularhizoctonia sp. CBS 109695]
MSCFSGYCCILSLPCFPNGKASARDEALGLTQDDIRSLHRSARSWTQQIFKAHVFRVFSVHPNLEDRDHHKSDTIATCPEYCVNFES